MRDARNQVEAEAPDKRGRACKCSAVTFLAFRRHSDPSPADDEFATVFIDQHGDALSIWLGTFHIQIYREWRLPYIGFENFDANDEAG